jgi:hypothetical protein
MQETLSVVLIHEPVEKEEAGKGNDPKNDSFF